MTWKFSPNPANEERNESQLSSDHDGHFSCVNKCVVLLTSRRHTGGHHIDSQVFVPGCHRCHSVEQTTLDALKLLAAVGVCLRQIHAMPERVWRAVQKEGQ